MTANVIKETLINSIKMSSVSRTLCNGLKRKAPPVIRRRGKSRDCHLISPLLAHA